MKKVNELTEVDVVVLKKVLENFLNGGQYYEDLEYYQQEEMKHRSKKVLDKLINVPDYVSKNTEWFDTIKLQKEMLD